MSLPDEDLQVFVIRISRHLHHDVECKEQCSVDTLGILQQQKHAAGTSEQSTAMETRLSHGLKFEILISSFHTIKQLVFWRYIEYLVTQPSPCSVHITAQD